MDSVVVRAVIEPCARTGEGWENKVMSAGEKEVNRLTVKRTSVGHADLNVKQMIVQLIKASTAVEGDY